MDLFGIGSTVNALSNLATGIMNNKAQKEQQEWNKNFQREQFEYLKEQNALQQHREDTAVQRKMNDLRESGLNPLAADATGGASTGATGSTTSFSGTEAAQMETNLLEGLSVEADSLYNLMSAKNGLTQQQAETENLESDLLTKEAQRREIEAGILNTMEDTNVKKKTQEQIAQNILESESNIAKNKADTAYTQSRTETENYNRNYSQNYGIRTTDAQGNISAGPISIDMNTASIFGKATSDMAKGIGNAIKNQWQKANKWWNKYNQYRGYNIGK